MDIFHIFPTPIAVSHFDGDISLDLLEELKTYSRKENLDNQSSFNTMVLNSKGLEDIKAFIDKEVKEYFDVTYAPRDGIEPYVTHSWVTYTKSMQGHHMHTHQNSLISGVFYLKASDNLVFSKSQGYEFFSIPAKDYNVFNSTSVNIDTEDKKLILFPSKLLHHVPPAEFEYERMAIAFNVFIKGELGSIEDGTQLTLK